MEREVEEALRDAQDAAAATAWRRAVQALTVRPAVVLASRDGALATRTASRLAAQDPRWDWPVVLLDPEDAAGEEASIAAEEALLTSRGAIWLTPVTAPLGRSDRLALDLLVQAGAPSARIIALADTELLARVSDDPAAELADIRGRLSDIAPADWPVHSEAELEAWLAALDQPDAVTRRKNEVAAHLLSAALSDLDRAVTRESEALGELDGSLAAEDAAVEKVRQDGARAAAHALGTLRRRTEEVVVDLRRFLQKLDESLETEVAAVADLDALRRALPHWIDQVVAGWLRDRLAHWRVAVLADLRDVPLAQRIAADLVLVPPAVHPSPIRSEASWGRAIGITAAVGGGIALAIFLPALWVPALAIAGGGIAWSMFGRDVRQAATRRSMVDSARSAVRRIASDLEEALRAQATGLDDAVTALGDRAGSDEKASRASTRADLEAARAAASARLHSARALRSALAARAQTLAPGTP